MIIGQRVAYDIEGKFKIGFIASINPLTILFDSSELSIGFLTNILPVVSFVNEEKEKEFEDLVIDIREPYIIYQSKKNVVFGIQFLYSMFYYLNSKIFDGKLKCIPIHLIDSLSIYGRYSAVYDNGRVIGSSARMVISKELNTPFEVMYVMCHEMVHQYQSMIEGKIVSGPEAHDSTFYKWKSRVNQLGIELSESADFRSCVYDPYIGYKSVYVLIDGKNSMYSCNLDILMNIARRRKGSWIARTNDINICYIIDNGMLTDKMVKELLKFRIKG